MPSSSNRLVCLAVLAVASVSPALAAEADALLGYVQVSREHKQRFGMLPSAPRGISRSKAYWFQSRLAANESPRLGPVVGYKVGYASKAAQEQFGVDEPERGRLFLRQQVTSGSAVAAEEFVEIMLETEVAFTLARSVDVEVASVDELKTYVRWVHPALDASDYRFAEGLKPTPADMVMTGLGAHRFVLGPGVKPEEVDLGGVTLSLSRNGEVIRSSPASEVLGSPWNSLLWLVNSVAKDRYAPPLPAGAVIVSGTADKAYKVTGEAIRGEYVGDCGPLGVVRLAIE